MGTTATHVWHLTEFVDAAPPARLTPSLVEQLMEIVELQAGQASEPHDHSSYAWRVVTGREPVVAGFSRSSPAVSALVERARLAGADIAGPPDAPDMVHADLNPSNVLVRDGAVVAVVLWRRILDVVGWEGAAVLTATQILLQLEWTTGLGRPDVVAEVVERGHRALDELSDARGFSPAAGRPTPSPGPTAG